MKCGYGCGREARYKFKYGNYCCESNHNKCPAIKKKLRDAKLGDRNPSKRPEVVKKQIKSNSGENHHSWDGGDCDWWSKKLRKKYKRCVLCNSSYRLEMHHKDSDRNNNDRNNLIVICKECHKFWHYT